MVFLQSCCAVALSAGEGVQRWGWVRRHGGSLESRLVVLRSTIGGGFLGVRAMQCCRARDNNDEGRVNKGRKVVVFGMIIFFITIIWENSGNDMET